MSALRKIGRFVLNFVGGVFLLFGLALLAVGLVLLGWLEEAR